MDTKPLGPFLGINNRRPDTALHIDKVGDFLKTAVNVDVDNAGKLRRREGTALVQAMGYPHSLHLTSATTGFLVRASALYAITLPAYTEVLLKVLASDAAMSYAQLGDSWYFSNGTDKGRITAGVAYPLGLATPSEPALVPIGGALLSGWYQVSLAYVNMATGEEGGVSPSSNLELASTGGLRVTLPGALTGATHVNIYLSASNGDVPLLHSTVVTGTATVDLTALATGRPAAERFEDVLPAGVLFASNGRLCSYAAGMVYVGLPFRPGYYLPAEGYIPFPANVSIAISNQGGTYIAADKTYWIPGDLGDVKETLTTVLPYGAVPGTAFEFPDKSMVGWFGAKGIVFGSAGGEVAAVMADNIDLVAPASGLAVVIECNGYRRVASCGWCVNLENKAATNYTGWDFTSLSGHYGTKADGIYSTDAVGTADASVGFGKQDFDSEFKKHLPAVYLGVDSTTAMQLRVQAPGADYTYSARSVGADMQIQRVDPGRGLLSNWFELTLSNTAGADFTLATVSFAPTATSRRI